MPTSHMREPVAYRNVRSIDDELFKKYIADGPESCAGSRRFRLTSHYAAT